MRWACARTSKDPNFFLPSPFRQNLDKDQDLDKQVNSNVNKEFLPKNSSQKSPLQKILPKLSLKKFHQKHSAKKYLQKVPKISKKFQRIPKKIQKIFQKNLKILKMSNSLHRTWRPSPFGLVCLLFQIVYQVTNEKSEMPKNKLQ